MIIINGLPGTGKTMIAQHIQKEYGYTYINDWDILKNNGILLDNRDDKYDISKSHATIIKKYIEDNSNKKIVLDLEYSITPSDYIKHGLDKVSTTIYLGFYSIDSETLFDLFCKSSSNNGLSFEELKDKIALYKKYSAEYMEDCKKNDITFIDVCKDRNLIQDEVITMLKKARVIK